MSKKEMRLFDENGEVKWMRPSIADENFFTGNA